MYRHYKNHMDIGSIKDKAQTLLDDKRTIDVRYYQIEY